jgi:hypothetical protein
MYTHLKERKYYEDLLDRSTVEAGRRNIKYYDDFFDEIKSKLKPGEKIDRPGNAIILNAFYMAVLGDDLIHRYNEREGEITGTMARDSAKDEQITHARLQEEPRCLHCSKQGLRIIDKSLMHRSPNHKHDDPEEVMFMLECAYCKKNCAFWEDGTAWKSKPYLCPKCSTELTHISKGTKNAINITYACPSCAHSYKEKLDMTVKKEKPDPDFEKDRYHYCLQDPEFRDHLMKMKRDFEEMARLGKMFKEREDYKHVYDVVKEMKKPKIAELTNLLTPALKKAGYIEFSLDKPEMGKDVYVGFNCLDSESGRGDNESRKALKKLVDIVLEETNWRLMSEGISYRLGYLNGRLRAYEGEEDLKNLVMKDKKLLAKVEASTDKAAKGVTPINKNRILKTPDGREVIL